MILPVEPVRFWKKVAIVGECWEWQASLNKGYGRYYQPDPPRWPPAHRVAYEQLIGPITDGMVLDHLCRNPKCVNPAHLEPVTQRINLLRGIGVPAIKAARDACPMGHAFDIANTYWYRGARLCRVCRRRQTYEYQRRKGLRGKKEAGK